MVQRYKKANTLTSLWFSSIQCFFSWKKSLRLDRVSLTIGHLKENQLFPEHAIINSEISLSVPEVSIYHHVVRRVDKYTFSMLSGTLAFKWNLLECFINEFLPEMDTYRESKIRESSSAIAYRRRGRCLEFVRASSFKTPRTTWRKEPYPFTLGAEYRHKGGVLKNKETYFRMLRLPVRLYKKIDRWWLAKKYWDW